MKNPLSLLGGASIACAAAMVSADAFLDLDANFVNGDIVVPLYTNVDTDLDGNPDKLIIRLNVYTAGTNSKSITTSSKSAPYPAASCTSPTSVHSDYSQRFTGLDGKPHRQIVLDLYTRCVESGTNEEKVTHRAVLYSANINLGSSWLKSWSSWGVTGSSIVDWDNDSTQEFMLTLNKGNKGRQLFIRIANGAIEADNSYLINRDISKTAGIPLSSDDRPTTAPCPSQTVLTNNTEFAALKAALTSNSSTLIYLDVPYDGADPDIFKKKCGFENYWDPADNIDEITATDIGLDPTNINLIGLLYNGHAGICTTGFTASEFGSGEGFPAAGTYHKELKVASGGTTYHIRFRVTASGSAAGNTFASESIDNTAMQNTVVYKVNGAKVVYADLTDAVLNGFSVATAGQAPKVQFTVRKSAADPVIFTSDAEMICATKQ